MFTIWVRSSLPEGPKGWQRGSYPTQKVVRQSVYTWLPPWVSTRHLSLTLFMGHSSWPAWPYFRLVLICVKKTHLAAIWWKTALPLGTSCRSSFSLNVSQLCLSASESETSAQNRPLFSLVSGDLNKRYSRPCAHDRKSVICKRESKRTIQTVMMTENPQAFKLSSSSWTLEDTDVFLML